MDCKLEERLRRWHEQIEKIEPIEKRYLELSANQKPLLSRLFLTGNGTQKEREATAYINPEWKIFSDGLVEAEISFNKEIRLLELKKKSFEAEYLTYKIENEATRQR